jgi:transposase
MTNPRSSDTHLLKLAIKRRWSTAEARIVLDALRRSGRPPEAFATTLGVPLPRLQRWLRAERREEAAPPPIQFAEVADPLSGHVFVFLNRRRNHVKMILWTRGGFTIVQKKLEAGTFTFARTLSPAQRRVEIGTHELAMLLEGIDVGRAKLAPRWAPAKPVSASQP